jgi:serine protease Do
MIGTKSSFFALAAVLGLSFGNATPHAEKSQAEIVRGVLPSVVNLTVLKSDGNPDAQGQYYGSGFVVDRSGLILTNRHVVEGAETISVTFADGTHSRAQLCAVSGQVDLAVVKVQGRTDLIPATWGNSDGLQMGDRVLAIGNPLGVGVSVSAGIVSALHRHISTNPSDDFVQTDAAINHGNSGGALVNGAGEVIGVNTAFLSDHANGGSLGIGFAIPASEATAEVNRLKDCNPQPSGWIGAGLQSTGQAQSAAMRADAAPHGLGLHLADEPGSSGASRVVVRSIDPAIALDAGLKSGDVVLRIGQQAAVSAEAVRAALHLQVEAGRSSVLMLVESGQTRRWIAMPVG